MRLLTFPFRVVWSLLVCLGDWTHTVRALWAYTTLDINHCKPFDEWLDEQDDEAVKPNVGDWVVWYERVSGIVESIEDGEYIVRAMCVPGKAKLRAHEMETQ